MESYSKSYEVIWADIDPNRHMRHTVYNDYAAQTRVGIFTDHGYSMDHIAKLGLGPILFREETRFLKEVYMSDTITVTCSVRAMRKDASRWTMVHEIFRGDGSKAAIVTVDGAWINLDTRKLGAPPEEMLEAIYDFPRTGDFEWME